MQETPTKEQYLDSIQKDLLEAGGVDNWDGHYDSLQNYGYTYSEDTYVDASDWLRCLENGGVDNWEWYDESLTDYYLYVEYLDELEANGKSVTFSDLDFYGWRDELIKKNAAEAEAKANEPPPKVIIEVRKPKGETEDEIYKLIVEAVGSEIAQDIFVKLMEDAKIFHANTYPIEYKNSLKEFKKTQEHPFEAAKNALFKAILANGKFDLALEEVAGFKNKSATERRIVAARKELAKAKRKLSAAEKEVLKHENIVKELMDESNKL